MRYNEALRELQYKRSNRFILYGEESYLKDSFIKVARTLNASFFEYYPGEEGDAKSSLFSINLFDEEQTIVLHYLDEMKIDGFKEAIPKYNGLLVVSLSEDANIKTKAMTGIIGLCTPVVCSKMSEYGPEYTSWLITKASEQGFTFIDGSEDLLYKRVGPDMLLLSKELEKLMVFKNQSKSITPDDVERAVCFSSVGSAFEILELLLKRDVVKVLKALDLYLKTSDDIEGLIFFLGSYFEKLYRMVLMNKSGMSADSIASILNMSPFLIKSKYLPRALSLGKEKLALCISNLVELEAGLRTSSIKNILIDKFIFSFV